MPSLAGTVRGRVRELQRLRALLPVGAVPSVVRRRADKMWADPDVRSRAERQMTHLLEFTERAPEIPELSRAYVEQTVLRAYLRWKVGFITNQEVRGIERLTTERDPARPVVLNFMHHARYDGMFGSVINAGAPLEMVMSPLVMGPKPPVEIRHHAKLMGRATPHPSSIGTAAIIDLMRPGVTMAIASDVPSRTPVRFLGREVMGSAGAARIATTTDSPVVVITAHREGGRHHLQLHEPLEPSSFTDPLDLLDAVLRIHEEAVLAWPEALEVPTARFAPLDAPPLRSPWE